MHFDMRANGRGLEHLWIKAGAYRHPSSTQTRTRTERQGPGVVLSDEDLAMDGQEIFAFTLKEVPAVFRHVMGRAGWSMHDVDAVIMHQANRFMIRTLAKKMQVPAAKMIECLAEFGNTSSASIPLAVVSSLRERARRGPANLVLLAFGAGLSWGGVTLACGPLAVPPLVTVDEGTGG
jgi:3-oxoacyl-[acyl-carrier-protein] synthase-3